MTLALETSIFGIKVSEPTVEIFRKMATVLFGVFAVIKSGLPSPSVSPMANDWGPLPAPIPISTLLAKLTVPLTDIFRKADALLLPAFVIARSSLPSPSKSPTTIEDGFVFADNVVTTPKLIPPGIDVVLRNIDTLLDPPFATAISVLPSPSKSATATELGFVPAVNCIEPNVSVPKTSPKLCNTETLLEAKRLTIIKSSRPSPSKSAIRTATGAAAVADEVGAEKLGLAPGVPVILRYTATVLIPEFTTAISNQPSPSKSPMANEEDTEPFAEPNVMAGPKLAADVVDVI